MPLKSYPGKLPSKTLSVCPECLKIIEATIFEEKGKVWIKKKCERHGVFEDVYWGDSGMYKKARKFAYDGRGVENPNVSKENPVCPRDCGLCSLHKSHTALANLVVTNRCDLSCWYCFFLAKKLGYVYEPSLKELREAVKLLVNEKPVPGNAVQLSLDHDEKILLKSPNGIITAEKIGDFVDKSMRNPRKLYKPIEHEKDGASGWEVLTIDKNLKTSFKPIKSTIRHENRGDLFEILTENGWRIKTTGSHSVFVLNEDGTISSKEVIKLNGDDNLIGCLSIPENTKKLLQINLIDLVLEKKLKLKNKVMVVFDKTDLKGYEKKLKRRINWDAVSLEEYLKIKTKTGKSIRYFNSKKEKKIPIELEITPELCRLLGYYAGEGCTYKSGIIFTFGLKEKELIEDFLLCVRKIFGNTNIRKRIAHGSSAQFYVEGYLYKLLFELLDAGKNANEKKTPWIIFNVSEKLKKEFLKSYFKCDGNVKIRKAGCEINHNTVSKSLASDLILLNSQLGITSKIETSTSKPHIVRKTGQYISKSSKKYRIVIGGKKNLSKSLWYLNGEIKERFKEYISSEEKHTPKYLRIPIIPEIRSLGIQKVNNPQIAYLLKRTKYDKSISKENLRNITDHFLKVEIEFNHNLNALSHSDIGIFRVMSIKRVKPNSKHVYDISVEGEAFFAGLGPLLAHNTGGEPSMRNDIIEIIKMIKEEGVDHVQYNTNGIRFAHDPEFVRKVREAGINTVYLSFDGVTPKTNPKNHWEIPRVLENARKAGQMGIVLVPTIIKSVNDHEVGDIIRFGFKNMDVVRGVNYQPVSLVGRMPRKDREKFRITIPDVIKDIEKQTSGEISKDDFYPVPSMKAITDFVEALVKKPQYSLSTHFACGMATYVFEEEGKMIPITRFVDIEGLFEYLEEKAKELREGKSKYVVGAKMLYKLNSFIDKKRSPKDFSLAKIIYNALIKHDYRALGVFHHRSLFIGMMHFQDKFNYDINRVMRCCIHYLTPEAIIPFCAFNVIPEWYREKVQERYSVSIPKWEKETGRKLDNELYRRDSKKLASSELYRKTYKGFAKGI